MNVQDIQRRIDAAGFPLRAIDGKWGPETAIAFDQVLRVAKGSRTLTRALQEQLRGSGYDSGPVDGIWGEKTQAAFSAALAAGMAHRSAATGVGNAFPIQPGVLSDRDYDDAAGALGVPVALIRAVKAIESGGAWFTDIRQAILDLDGPGGFIDGRQLPKILFEAHLFSAETGHRFDKTHPEISSPTWNPALYIGGQAEYGRLHAAMLLDEGAALRCASWGMFQILGRNHLVTGYPDVFAFVAAMKRGEREQLLAFVDFVKNTLGLLAKFRQASTDPETCRPFCAAYNGSGYASHGYHTKLAAAVRSLS